MPGICGILDTRRTLDLAEITDNMLAAMRHESWYRSEDFVDAPAGVALGRVSLGFVNTAPQPASIEQGRVIAVMDGELYEPERVAAQVPGTWGDMKADRHAALLVHGYLANGLEFLKSLHGSFAAAIWDSQRQCLVLVNDRFATRPVYYAILPGRFVFSSSLKSLMADGGVSREMSAMGLAQFFSFGHYLGDDTSLEAVRVLPAAAHVLIQAETLQVRREQYTRTGVNRDVGEIPRGEWLQRIDTAFVRAVERRVGGTAKLGLSLSGGLDARSILGVIDHKQITIQTVCLGMPGSLDHRSSTELTTLVRCPHHKYVLGDGFLDHFRQHLENMVRLTDGQYLSQCIVMPTFPLYRQLGIEVLLRGHAGELMHMEKAYNYSLDDEALAIRTGGELEEWLLRRLQAYMLDGVEKPLFRDDLQREIPALAREALRRDLQAVEHIEPPLQRIWALFVHQRLRRETVLSMVKFRSVVEPRLPFLDNDLVDLLLAAPTDLKLAEEIQTSILRRHCPAFLAIANANTGAPVGAGSLRRRLASLRMKVLGKMGVPGYQPYERLGLWLRRELAPTVKEILLSDECLGNGVFQADGVRHVVEQHLQNRRNHTFLLMALMVSELARKHLLAGCSRNRSSEQGHAATAGAFSPVLGTEGGR